MLKGEINLNDNKSAFKADEYDDNIKRVIPYYEDIYAQTADIVNKYVQSSVSWLDVGCGTGKMGSIAFKAADIEKFAFCDSSSEMIETVKKRFDFPESEFIIADIRELNYANEFDVVTAIQVNHYFEWEDRITAVKKCFNALKNGGIFISFENFAPYSNIGEKLFLDRWRSYQLNHGRSRRECEQHIGRYKREYFPITLSEHTNVRKMQDLPMRKYFGFLICRQDYWESNRIW